MADQDDLKTLFGIALAFLVHLGDQRAGRVEHRQGPVGRSILDRLGDAVGAENGNRTVRNFVQLLDEAGALGGEFTHDPFVVHNLVAHIDRRSVTIQRLLHDLDRALDSGAEAARLGEDYSHRKLPSGSTETFEAVCLSWSSYRKPFECLDKSIHRHKGPVVRSERVEPLGAFGR